MEESGYKSETFTTDYYSTIHQRSDWDLILSEKYGWLVRPLKPFLAFAQSLFKYDVFFLSYDGFFIGATPLRRMQDFLFKVASKKVVLIPYGSDAFVYRRIRSTPWAHALLVSYPGPSRRQDFIANSLDYWNKCADAVVPGMMGPDGFGRWDVLASSSLVLDLEKWSPSVRNSTADGRSAKVVIAHSPNHRGCKGTEFVLDAVEQLERQGLDVELLLLEKMSNVEVNRILNEETDILVEQLIATGHGLNGLEGLASGLPTISNLEDEQYTLSMRRWSFFNECPLVSASPESLVEVLGKLVTRPDLRKELGRAGREYVEKYHGFDSAQYLFSKVLDYVHGKKQSLINLYHPILGEYPNRSPKIQHPLVKNQILD